ncbi:transposase [Streptomyces sp. SPB4]|nr:transposase [Streptomyces sp. SPB4]
MTGGNRNDATQLIPLLKAVPSVRGKRGGPRRRPDIVLGDRGYDHDKYRRLVWALGVKPVIARRGTEHGSGLGTQRWVVERAFAYLH